MKTIIYRPAVETAMSFKTGQLEECFERRELISSTVCENYIVYVFSEVT